MAIGGTPTNDQLVTGAKKYDVVVLNAWEAGSAKFLKQLNPAITVLVYKDLASTRSYAVKNGLDHALLPTGVGYAAALPEWFAKDKDGRRIEWLPYPGHWQMRVWDSGYANAWVQNVRRELEETPVWDGVLADNAMSTLAGYNRALLEDSASQEASDAKLRAGLDALVRKAGEALNADGKILVPNLSEGRLNMTRWKTAANYGGAMDEQFAHWGFDVLDGFVTNWGPSGWIGQTEELTVPLTLLVTHGSKNDSTAFRFGYGSALVRAKGRVVWTADTDNQYSRPHWFDWQSVNLGDPTSDGAPNSSGVWLRRFEHGVVVVNPSTKSASATIGSGYCAEAGGGAASTVTVPAHDARLFERRSTC